MNNIPPGVVIGAQLVASHLKSLPQGSSLEVAVTAAFVDIKRPENCFMCTNDDEKFRAGVGALLLYYKDQPKIRERIELEMRVLASISAAAQGIPVNIAAAIPDGFEAIGLLGAFRAAT